MPTYVGSNVAARNAATTAMLSANRANNRSSSQRDEGSLVRYGTQCHTESCLEPCQNVEFSLGEKLAFVVVCLVVGGVIGWLIDKWINRLVK